jgi:hypothetical protein
MDSLLVTGSIAYLLGLASGWFAYQRYNAQATALIAKVKRDVTSTEQAVKTDAAKVTAAAEAVKTDIGKV